MRTVLCWLGGSILSPPVPPPPRGGPEPAGAKKNMKEESKTLQSKQQSSKNFPVGDLTFHWYLQCLLMRLTDHTSLTF